MSEKITSQMAIEMEDKYGAHNYHPLPVVLSKGGKAFFCGMPKANVITIFFQLIQQ